METFQDCNVEMIKCGITHNYLKCDVDKHYLWGSNSNHECLELDYDDDFEESLFESKTTNPHDIATIVYEKANVKKIKQVSLGYDNTKILVYDPWMCDILNWFSYIYNEFNCLICNLWVIRLNS